MATRKDSEGLKETTSDFMFRVRSEEICKKPKQKYYWEIIKRRTEMINSAVKKM